MVKPYDWQLPVIRAQTDSLRKNRVFVNSACTGAGKTVMALASAAELGRPTLVVAPKVSLTQWRRTAEAMGCAGLLVDCVNPEQISKPTGCRWYRRGSKKPSDFGKWDIPENLLVIWDETHRSTSGMDSTATMAMAVLKAYPGTSLLAMSATVADSPVKLRALGWWMGLHGFNRNSFFNWCRRYGCSTVLYGTRSVFQFTKNRAKAREALSRLRADMGEMYLAVRPEDIPGFPDQTVDTVLVDLTDGERKEIDEAYAEMPARLLSPRADELAEIIRLRQKIEFIKARTVAELAVSSVSDGRAAVIFCNFTDPRLRVEKALAKAGVSFGSIYGGQKEDERQAMIDAFQANRLDAAVVMTAAGGAALSLHDERHERPRESFITPSYNAAEVKQALGRIRRCNGTPVCQHIVLGAGTVEERVNRALSGKLDNIDTLTDADLAPSEREE